MNIGDDVFFIWEYKIKKGKIIATVGNKYKLDVNLEGDIGFRQAELFATENDALKYLVQTLKEEKEILEKSNKLKSERFNKIKETIYEIEYFLRI